MAITVAELLVEIGVDAKAAEKAAADGSVDRAYTIEVDKASKAAIEAIKAAGALQAEIEVM